MIDFKKPTSLALSLLLVGLLGFGVVHAHVQETGHNHEEDISRYLEDIDISRISIAELQDKINEKKKALQDLANEKEQYNKNVEELRAEQLTLQNQLSILDNEIAKTELDVERINTQSEAVQLEIEKVEEEIKIKEATIARQADSLEEFLRVIHLNDSYNYVSLLTQYDNFSDFFDQMQYTQDVENQLHSTLLTVKNTKIALETDRQTLDQNRRDLEALRLERARQKIVLEEEKSAKETLLAQTNSNEIKFQELLALVRAEKRKLDISLADIESKLSLKRKQEILDKYKSYGEGEYVWPLPYQGFTVTFHDPSYPFKHIVGNHSGLDMRTLVNGRPTTGLPIRSTSHGTVVKTIHNGRYVGNAVFVLHGVNTLSAYYHLSRIDVTEDQFVEAGEIIGLSGGMPGTYGAGLSSGPHLHFELRVNGLPVDPLDYLPPPLFVEVTNIAELF